MEILRVSHRYRTTSSFERYNDGRKLWSQIVHSTRTFARTTWFHVPGTLFPITIIDANLTCEFIHSDVSPKPSPADAKRSEDEQRARSIIEKKSVINLVEAFAYVVDYRSKQITFLMVLSSGLR